MANEVVETQSSNLLPVNKQAVEELKNQRELLAHFVRSQLVEAKFDDKSKSVGSYGEGDYGVIPGTPKPCLFKSGAEKLLRLFGLGVRFTQTDKEVDRHANFALYTYKAEVYSLASGKVIAECEATTNSQEVKYKERTKWITNKKGVREAIKEETPIYDVLNTLQKMAQKRALVGATILATGASEYFTQDSLEPEDIPAAAAAQEAKDVTPPQDAAPTDAAPECCGKPMMLSKYVDKEFGHKPWYCLNCKKKLPSESAA